ncbi:unnamed protein product [Caenorhabditis auriculariae]|uniref:Uncharacterized protein n=1 Tax=Caenorhabditis auriculariae TaxID=2777116 RepID=A0A8S1HSJ8_9PELO|nr:unnamed protein product [Caenorhabditis auriculariae]
MSLVLLSFLYFLPATFAAIQYGGGSFGSLGAVPYSPFGGSPLDGRQYYGGYGNSVPVVVPVYYSAMPQGDSGSCCGGTTGGYGTFGREGNFRRFLRGATEGFLMGSVGILTG